MMQLKRELTLIVTGLLGFTGVVLTGAKDPTLEEYFRARELQLPLEENVKVFYPKYGKGNFTFFDGVKEVRVEDNILKFTLDKEKAVLDVLYFHLRGRAYPFDLYSDIRFDELDRHRVREYLKRYENPKFIAFAETVLDTAKKGHPVGTDPTRPATREGLILWVMHRFASAFGEHAVIKGGLALRLLDSPRSTNDIDYVFVPFESKKDIVPGIRKILNDLEGADVKINLHSTMLRADIRMDSAVIQIEVSVDNTCDAIPIATGGFAREQGRPSRIVRIMSLDTALAHKLAAWNERRLARDLYDCYFLASRLGEKPSLAVLQKRFSEIRSQLPRLRRKRKMSATEFARELRQEAENLTQKRLDDELGGLLPNEEMAGLAPRIKAALNMLAEQLEKID